MVQIVNKGSLLINNKDIISADETARVLVKEKYNIDLNGDLTSYRDNTMAKSILDSHNLSGKDTQYKIKFDALASHDITYVGIIQTARASGLNCFPVPYVLTNCHNSLCAVGGTINEDDHMFGLSAAKKYGGIFVPAHLAVIHTYMREMMSGGGKMILGSDSHTRYGALGTMAVGEGGPELVKQILGKTYDIERPEVIAVNMYGNVKNGVGPQDVALAIIGIVFKNGFVKNKVMEFIGDGIFNLPVEFRNGIDVMTTETTCWSSIWKTDAKVRDYYKMQGRENDFVEMKPGEIAYYDGVVNVDLSKIEPMIALPSHPSNVYTIREFNANVMDIIRDTERELIIQAENEKINIDLTSKINGGRFKADQAVIAGCAGGTFDNLCAAADILENKSIGTDEFTMSVYPGSQPLNVLINNNGIASKLMKSGIVMRSAFCGPCFGAGDVPANNGFSIRHTTRNFPNREGSKPGNGQFASVALMDSRSIAATAANGGYITGADTIDIEYKTYEYNFDGDIYKNRVYNGYNNPQKSNDLKFGPNIIDWPKMPVLTDNILLKMCSVITDEVTTTDELIPSGETSSYRSNPLKLAEFTLSRKDPDYVERAKSIQLSEIKRAEGKNNEDIFDSESGLSEVRKKIKTELDIDIDKVNTSIGSVIFANKPGDGSAREQAASCQKVLGGFANIAIEYATKRYRSNLINWGMIPFIYKGEGKDFTVGDFIFVPEVKTFIGSGEEKVKAYIINSHNEIKTIELFIAPTTKEEKKIITAGCLINYWAQKN